MNITFGNVPPSSSGDQASNPVGESRRRRAPDASPAGGREPSPQHTAEPEERTAGLDPTRARLLLLQRDLGKAQGILGGLEGVAELLQEPRSSNSSAGGTLDALISRVTYRGEAVLAPLQGELARILRDRDDRSLERLIGESKDHLGRLAQELSRYETAKQNSRALGADGEALRALKEGIQQEGLSLLAIKRENVLRLLG